MNQLAHMNKGIVIAGTQSSSGKTVVNALILCALKARGVDVQAFKTGPDYIDTAFSSSYAGTPAYNLDAWLMGEARMKQLAHERTENALGVVEGVMGLIDGVSPTSNEGSTLAVAELLDWPVVLVIPVAKRGRSLLAALTGFLLEAGPGRIGGLVLNHVSGPGHVDYLKRVFADFPIPILGCLPQNPDLRWPERHLGLKASQEFSQASRDKLAAVAEEHLNMDSLLELVDNRCGDDKMLETAYREWLGKLPRWAESSGGAERGRPVEPVKSTPIERFGLGRKLAVARDEAFHFYYQENLDVLAAWGFELIEFSPLNDSALPEGIDGVVMGGGFPEVYVEALSSNVSMRDSVKAYVESGGACYAECGGFMYLCEGMQGRDGELHPMVGLVPGHTVMTERLQHFGYSDCLQDEESYRAHEFHYSRWSLEEEQANLWDVRKATRGTVRREGYGKGRLHASYLHLYFPGAESLFRRLFAPERIQKGVES